MEKLATLTVKLELQLPCYIDSFARSGDMQRQFVRWLILHITDTYSDIAVTCLSIEVDGKRVKN